MTGMKYRMVASSAVMVVGATLGLLALALFGAAAVLIEIIFFGIAGCILGKHQLTKWPNLLGIVLVGFAVATVLFAIDWAGSDPVGHGPGFADYLKLPSTLVSFLLFWFLHSAIALAVQWLGTTMLGVRQQEGGKNPG